ncbi:MAG TPA: hypothetical protein VFF64_03255 [Candidatus Eremiobacteraceae bacterium]|nr:hypothetical protein [Candidatus Eremiobacteraceae bacterium]
MNSKRALFVIFCFAVPLLAQRSDDFHLRNREQGAHDYPVFSSEDVQAIARQGATLDQMQVRLNSIDENVKDVKKTLDKEVMPTIHVFNFLKWIIGIIIAVAIGTMVPDWIKRARVPQAPA